MRQTFTIDMKAVSWNTLARKNHWTFSKVFHAWAEATYEAVKAARIVPVTQYPISIEVEAHWRHKRRHDVSNIVLKPIEDQLVTMGILKDDSLEYVTSVSFRGKTGCPRDELVVCLWS